MRVLETGTETNGGCTSARCPYCAKTGFTIIERVIVGSTTLDQCYCKACGASWVTDRENAAAGTER